MFRTIVLVTSPDKNYKTAVYLFTFQLTANIDTNNFPAQHITVHYITSKKLVTIPSVQVAMQSKSAMFNNRWFVRISVATPVTWVTR